jgi:hypothetical protein
VVPPVVAPELRLEAPVAADIRVKEQAKKLNTAEDFNNRDANVRAVQEEIDAFEARRKFEQGQQEQALAAAEQQKNNEFLNAKQDIIDDHPYGDVPAQYGSTLEHVRIDENGMPIRADLSMEAQNLQDPLQRNLWGDEMDTPTGDGGVPLTQAIDSMPGGPSREQAIAGLRGYNEDGRIKGIENSVSMPDDLARFEGEGGTLRGGKQSGAVDFQTIVDLFPAFAKSKFRETLYRGTTNPDSKLTPSTSGGTLGNGLYTAVRPQYASAFADGVGGNVHPVYVNVTRPLIINGPGDPTIRALMSLGESRESAMQIIDNADKRNKNITTEIQTRAERQGYDGIALHRGGSLSEVVAFKQDQVKSAISPSGGMGRKQAGSIDFQAITDIFTGKRVVGGSTSGKLPMTGRGITMPDSVDNPISPATIARKNQLASAEKYARLQDSNYGDIKTIEELKTKLEASGKGDINNNPVRDYTIAGVEGMVRNFPAHPIFKFVRSKLTDARNNTARFETEYVTGLNGLNTLYRDMNKAEWTDVAEALQAASKSQIAITPALIAKWGFNEKQAAYINRVSETMDAMHATASEGLTAMGQKGLGKRVAYVPSMFSGAYTSLVGHMVTGSDGKQKFIIKGVAQGDTKAQHAAALEHYTKQGDKFSTVVKLRDRMLTGGVHKSNRVFDGFNDLVNAIAEGDKDFAAIKAMADDYAANKINKINEFDVHAKKKTGVVGSLGDRPWLTREENAKQFLEGITNYMAEGAERYNYMEPLYQVNKIMHDPEITTDRQNTMKYLERHVSHVTGQNVGAHGVFLNQVWNTTMKSLGSSPQNVSQNIHRIHGAASAYMMGLWNPAFFITQIVQPAASGIPEAVGVNKITETGFASSVAKVTAASPLIDAALSLDNPAMLSKLPQHLVEAYKYAQDIGMTVFSESELSREVTQSKVEKGINNAIHIPAQLSERLTRPAVFLTYFDMFHNAGFDQATAQRAAQYATESAMVNYHPNERPMLYATFGHTGNFMGALTTYKHNLATGMWNRGKGALTQGDMAPAIAASVLAATLYGVSGIAGYQEMDQLVQAATGNTIKEQVFGSEVKKLPDGSFMEAMSNPETHKQGVWHGYASVLSGWDLQARLSMASLAPDTVLEATSPQLGVLVDIGTKTYELFKNQDETSQIALIHAMTPAGMKGISEQKMLTDSEGFLTNPKGQRMFEEPRSPNEQFVRKVIGLRPLRERLEREDVYNRGQRNLKNEKKLKESSERFKAAVARGDDAGVDFHYKKYMELDGDPQVLFNDPAIKKWLEESMKSERERQAGTPNNNIGSIRKYEGMTQ